ncbi:MAG: hypothetical protein KJS92_01900 [Bacteroidetes bacterium]|nr:hypothetical protein [Bacteroidota bacterium]
MVHRNFRTIQETMHFLNENMLCNLDESIYGVKRVEIDFSQCDYVEPYHLAPLACVLHEYLEAGFNIDVLGLNARLQKYFDETGFFEFCEGKYVNAAFPDPKDKNTLPLWRIMPGAHNVYPQLAEGFFETNGLTGRDLQPLNSALGEMMNNVFDHSECKIPGYTVTQFHPNRKLLHTCVCDLGCTIPKSVNDYLTSQGLPSISSAAALDKAMEKNFSSYTQPHNRGLGLDNLVSIVRALKGRFLLVSGSSACIMEHEEEVLLDMQSNFPGTMVVITLNTDHLEVKEEEQTDDLHIF